MTPCLAPRRPISRSSTTRPSPRSSTCITYRNFDEAIAIHNEVPQGLSSAIFTNDLREAEKFLSAARQRLRHRQRQHRHERRGDRRRFRRREGNRRRTRKRQRLLEDLHAPTDGHDQLLDGTAARPGHPLRRSGRRQLDRLTNRPGQAERRAHGISESTASSDLRAARLSHVAGVGGVPIGFCRSGTRAPCPGKTWSREVPHLVLWGCGARV